MAISVQMANDNGKTKHKDVDANYENTTICF